jgi:queuine tRNA-ribosyltransferase
MFDCVMPTVTPETECCLLTVRLILKIKKWQPIDETIITYVDTEYTKAYLRHFLQ